MLLIPKFPNCYPGQFMTITETWTSSLPDSSVQSLCREKCDVPSTHVFMSTRSLSFFVHDFLSVQDV